MVKMDGTVVVGPDQVSVDLSNESVILHTPRGLYFGLDELGQRIWQLIQQPVAVRSVHETILNEFDVGSEQSERDLLQFLNDLETEGLICVEDAEHT